MHYDRKKYSVQQTVRLLLAESDEHPLVYPGEMLTGKRMPAIAEAGLGKVETDFCVWRTGQQNPQNIHVLWDINPLHKFFLSGNKFRSIQMYKQKWFLSPLWNKGREDFIVQAKWKWNKTERWNLYLSKNFSLTIKKYLSASTICLNSTRCKGKGMLRT